MVPGGGPKQVNIYPGFFAHGKKTKKELFFEILSNKVCSLNKVWIDQAKIHLPAGSGTKIYSFKVINQMTRYHFENFPKNKMIIKNFEDLRRFLAR